MTFGTILLLIGGFSGFMFLISMFIPHEADSYRLFGSNSIIANVDVLKAFLAIVGLYFANKTFSRNHENKNENKMENNFFIITIFYAGILLFVNLVLIVICNDLGIAQTTGGIRAIATTIWWIALAIFLIYSGIHSSHRNTEKLLGFILLVITIAKIAFYDLSSMAMDKKIIVLMLAGGAMLIFSYILQKKGYLNTKNENISQQ